MDRRKGQGRPSAQAEPVPGSCGATSYRVSIRRACSVASSTITKATSLEQATSSSCSNAKRTTHSSPVVVGLGAGERGSRRMDSSLQGSSLRCATRSQAIRLTWSSLMEDSFFVPQEDRGTSVFEHSENAGCSSAREHFVCILGNHDAAFKEGGLQSLEDIVRDDCSAPSAHHLRIRCLWRKNLGCANPGLAGAHHLALGRTCRRFALSHLGLGRKLAVLPIRRPSSS